MTLNFGGAASLNNEVQTQELDFIVELSHYLMEYLNCLNFGSADRSRRRKYDAVDQMKKKRKMMVEIVDV